MVLYIYMYVCHMHRGIAPKVLFRRLVITDVTFLAALQPSDITSFFEPIFEQAKDLRKAYSRFSTQTRVPFITVSNL